MPVLGNWDRGGRARASWGRIAIAVVVGAALGGAGLHFATREVTRPVRVTSVAAQPLFPGGKTTPSNITRESYVGPEACRSCHKKNYASWLEHPHRRMNQWASDESVLGDFGDVLLTIGRSNARFERGSDGDRRVVLERDGGRRVYRVRRTIGSRIKQYYVGVLETGLPAGRNQVDDEVVLPFGWWIEQRRWMPLNYFEDYGADYDAWSPRDVPIKFICVYCHNTMPYADRFTEGNKSLLGYLPTDITFDPIGLKRVLKGQPPQDRVIGVSTIEPSPVALETGLVTVGISCESCHFGSAAHANDEAEYRFGISSPHVSVAPADALVSKQEHSRHSWVTRAICRQCHASTGSAFPDGAAHVNSREALELDQGECASQIACTNCHNPHVAGPPSEGGPDDPTHRQACLECHEQYAVPRAAAEHSRHVDNAVDCLDCHMPKITAGIARAVRTHRISIPGDTEMLAEGAPNACNLCHLDKSIGWTARHLAARWGRPGFLPPPEQQHLWETAAADRWGHSDQTTTRSILIDALERRGDAMSWGLVLSFVNDPAPTNRAMAASAVERRIGRRLSTTELDVTAPPEQRATQAAALLDTVMAGTR